MRGILNGQSGGAKINGIVEEYIVQAGSTISAGDFVDFVYSFTNTDVNLYIDKQTTYITAIALSETSVFVAYTDNTTGYGEAVIITISGDAITLGTPVIFRSLAISVLKSVKMSETSILIVFRNNSSQYQQAIVLSINGNIITAGTAIDYTTMGLTSTEHSVVRLTDTRAIVLYRRGTGGLYGVILTLNGTAISKSADLLYSSSIVQAVSAVAIDESRVFLAFSLNSANVKAVVLTVSVDSFTYGTAITLLATTMATNIIESIKLNSTSMFVGFSTNGSGYGVVVTISGTALVAGPSRIFAGDTSSAINTFSLSLLSQSRVLISYSLTVGYYGCAIMARIYNAEFITYDSTYVFYATAQNFGISVKLNSGRILELFRNNSTLKAGSVFVGIAKYVKAALLQNNICGVAKTKGIESETIKAFTLSE
ncbi:hypothetical protein [Acetobacterium wieringae]|uniref:hypothetical protein n=1 Tax=Acetobacterium wieringae TaxID=52694 RepID=UPI002033356E|nr:hypothetical protein [Acetobacterium wieringae]URN83960.1 hypothetical protein CHL1_003124 [Acetobacterium wieringae]